MGLTGGKGNNGLHKLVSAVDVLTDKQFDYFMSTVSTTIEDLGQKVYIVTKSHGDAKSRNNQMGGVKDDLTRISIELFSILEGTLFNKLLSKKVISDMLYSPFTIPSLTDSKEVVDSPGAVVMLLDESRRIVLSVLVTPSTKGFQNIVHNCAKGFKKKFSDTTILCQFVYGQEGVLTHLFITDVKSIELSK